MKNKIALALASLLLIQASMPAALGTFSGGNYTYTATAAAVDAMASVKTYSPASKALNISLTPGLMLTFDRSVALSADGASKTFTLKKQKDNKTVRIIKGSDLQFQGDGTQVVLPIDVLKLEPNTGYYILADTGIVTPTLTNEEIQEGAKALPWSGITSAITWTFKTGAEMDATDPQLLTTMPTANKFGVKPDAPLGLTFDEAIVASEGDILITELDAAQAKTNRFNRIPVLSEQVTGLGSANVSIEPDTNFLKPGTSYLVEINANVFTDLSGRFYSRSIGWKFRTESANNVPPTLQARNPQIGLAGAATTGTLSMTFSEPVTPNTGNVSIYRLNDGKLIQTLTPSDFTMDTETGTKASAAYTGLDRGTTYYVLAAADSFRDSDSTPFAGISSSRDWTFTTTGDALALNTLNPVSGTTGVSSGSNLQLMFSRVVYPNSGAGDIRIRRNDGVVDTLTLGSGRITGGGTTTINLLPTAPLAAGYTYTVEVPVGLFGDSEGNVYPKVGQPLTWSFSTSINNSLLQMTSMTPADRTATASVDSKPTIRFNRSVTLSGTGITLYRTGGAKVEADVSVNSANLAEVIISPKEKLTAATFYYVDLDNGSVRDRSNEGITFAGLKGSTSWSFQTATSDTSLPTIQSAKMDSPTLIRLAYNKSLNASQTPLLSSYTVWVNGEKRIPGSVYISGDSVYIRLDTGIAVGQDVKVSYDPAVRPLVDNSGNAAASLSSYTVTNSIDSAMPKPKEGNVYNNMVTLIFENSLKTPAAQAYNQFTVNVDGRPYEVRSMNSSSQALLLYLNAAVPDGAVVKVNYAPNGAPLQDYLGQNISAFSDFNIRNLQDTKPPEFVNAELSGSELVLNYNEALRPDQIPANSQFSVLSAGAPVYVNGVKIEGSKVRLSLASSLIASGNITVSYVPGVLKLSDLNGNAAGYLNLQPVGAASGTSGIRSATGNGSQIAVTFTGSLYTPEDTAFRQFVVLADSTAVEVTSASFAGSTLTLKLASDLRPGQTVALTYMPGGSPLKNLSGSAVIAFNRMPVENLTGKSVTDSSNTSQGGNGSMLPASDFGKAMLIMDRTGASSSDASTTFNTNTHRYTINSDALKKSLDDAFARSAQNGTVVFEVPDAEAAGLVSVPIQPLKDAYAQRKGMSFAVRYKDTVYEVPLSALNNVSGGSDAQLDVQIESLPTSSLSRTIEMLGDANARMLSNPIDIQTSVGTKNGVHSVSEDRNIQGMYRMKLNVNAPSTRTSVVYFDGNSASPSFTPSKSDTQSAGMLLSGSFAGSRTLIPVNSTTTVPGANGHWSQSTVNEMGAKYVLSPNLTKAFAPKAIITRGEFAELITRGLGLKSDAVSASSFSDIGSSKYPIGSIGAAVHAGVVTGYPNGTFRPNDSITREEMAIMMVRALNYTGTDVKLNSGASQILSAFKDSKAIKYTDEAAKAVQAGVIQGGSGGRFNPKGNATKSEAVVMLARVLQNADYLN
ncbi:Ig-like domain-containing protein [Saccharibacillus sp. JS10]|uniref:Ig-like domain-containing protein n=1 Tax=Saccharibacillus sp. JS10 TaxID=2950552 RepID=UPI00210E8E65|nr:Ig-like domain-containing protein [Saccharibacillus sp. JS10]MCQ4088144.1 Ig-like domain-containing protein [Saccharibacillus sp. JS10]